LTWEPIAQGAVLEPAQPSPMKAACSVAGYL
jgi:hypothetical protein